MFFMAYTIVQYLSLPGASLHVTLSVGRVYNNIDMQTYLAAQVAHCFSVCMSSYLTIDII